jgi:hypothetical protein
MVREEPSCVLFPWPAGAIDSLVLHNFLHADDCQSAPNCWYHELKRSTYLVGVQTEHDHMQCILQLTIIVAWSFWKRKEKKRKEDLT